VINLASTELPSHETIAWPVIAYDLCVEQPYPTTEQETARLHTLVETLERYIDQCFLEYDQGGYITPAAFIRELQRGARRLESTLRSSYDIEERQRDSFNHPLRNSPSDQGAEVSESDPIPSSQSSPGVLLQERIPTPGSTSSDAQTSSPVTPEQRSTRTGLEGEEDSHATRIIFSNGIILPHTHCTREGYCHITRLHNLQATPTIIRDPLGIITRINCDYISNVNYTIT
jgi:hypothetical protein